jgi:hypothetical protein
MKCIGVVLAFFLLGGCGTYHTLEELEERREHKIAMRTARSGVSCPAGTTLVCQRGGVNEGCACIAFDDVQNSFADWD